MAGSTVSDDIKIIAQFLAAKAGAPDRWDHYTQDAFRLRQQLKTRGGYRFVRSGRA